MTPSQDKTVWTYEPSEIDGDDVISAADILKDGKSIFTLDCGEFNGIPDEIAKEIIDGLNSLSKCKEALEKAKPFLFGDERKLVQAVLSALEGNKTALNQKEK